MWLGLRVLRERAGSGNLNRDLLLCHGIAATGRSFGREGRAGPVGREGDAVLFTLSGNLAGFLPSTCWISERLGRGDADPGQVGVDLPGSGQWPRRRGCCSGGAAEPAEFGVPGCGAPRRRLRKCDCDDGPIYATSRAAEKRLGFALARGAPAPSVAGFRNVAARSPSLRGGLTSSSAGATDFILRPGQPASATRLSWLSRSTSGLPALVPGQPQGWGSAAASVARRRARNFTTAGAQWDLRAGSH